MSELSEKIIELETKAKAFDYINAKAQIDEEQWSGGIEVVALRIGYKLAELRGRRKRHPETDAQYAAKDEQPVEAVTDEMRDWFNGLDHRAETEPTVAGMLTWFADASSVRLYKWVHCDGCSERIFENPHIKPENIRQFIFEHYPHRAQPVASAPELPRTRYQPQSEPKIEYFDGDTQEIVKQIRELRQRLEGLCSKCGRRQDSLVFHSADGKCQSEEDSLKTYFKLASDSWHPSFAQSTELPAEKPFPRIERQVTGEGYKLFAYNEFVTEDKFAFLIPLYVYQALCEIAGKPLPIYHPEQLADAIAEVSPADEVVEYGNWAKDFIPHIHASWCASYHETGFCQRSTGEKAPPIKKPVVGIYPRKLWLEDRCYQLERCIERYHLANEIPPHHICAELDYINAELALIYQANFLRRNRRLSH